MTVEEWLVEWHPPPLQTAEEAAEQTERVDREVSQILSTWVPTVFISTEGPRQKLCRT